MKTRKSKTGKLLKLCWKGLSVICRKAVFAYGLVELYSNAPLLLNLVAWLFITVEYYGKVRAMAKLWMLKKQTEQLPPYLDIDA